MAAARRVLGWPSDRRAARPRLFAARPQLAQAVLRGEHLAARPTRACASCAGSSTRRSSRSAIAVALSQFAGINRVAASLLASGAIAAAIIGFAARQTLANLVAGIMLAITQPLRVGDWVSSRTSTAWSRTSGSTTRSCAPPATQRIVIPERAARERDPAQRHARRRAASRSTCRVWLPPGADAARAVEVLQAETGAGGHGRRGDAGGHPARGRRRARAAARARARARRSCACGACGGCRRKACCGRRRGGRLQARGSRA